MKHPSVIKSHWAEGDVEFPEFSVLIRANLPVHTAPVMCLSNVGGEQTEDIRVIWRSRRHLQIAPVAVYWVAHSDG